MNQSNNLDSKLCQTPYGTLAMVTIPCQPWDTPYDRERGLKTGTIFPNLDLPFYLRGETYGR